jgi:hypothetical protein
MKLYNEMLKPPSISNIDLLATNVFDTSVESIKRRIMFAVYQLGIEPSSFFFEVSKK